MDIRVTLCSATLGEDGKIEPPLGPLYIASALEKVNAYVDFRDYQICENANGFSGDSLAEFLKGHEKIVAISCFVDMLPAVIEAARILNEKRPDTIFILGGPGPTAKARDILEAYDWIDYIVRSEGEETTQELIGKIRSGSQAKIDGLTYRDGSEIVEGADRKRIAKLDDIPLPAYHLIDFTDYDNARIITTRGCSYRCSFCDVTALWGNRSVYRGITNVIDEMEWLRDTYGISYIGIVDDTFVLNRKRVLEFCSELIARDTRIKWGCFGRINLMDEELIKQMSRAGCRAIFYGIDSGSQKILDETLKRVKVEDIYRVVKLSAKYFDQIEASFIWGYPTETFEDFTETLNLAASLSEFAPKVNVQMHMLSPLPASPIYREFTGELLEPEAEDKEWMLLPTLFIDENSAELRQIIRANPHIYPGFFSFPTPNKLEKRNLLFKVMKNLHQMIGRTLLDSRVAELLKTENSQLEKKLVRNLTEPVDKIGVGLALGYFKRLRRHKGRGYRNNSINGSRGAKLVRERNG
jgi:radical SAM superfamily enzyme YgiQ (UPF0313 family)